MPKGAALALSHYADPALRERDDTDLLVPVDAVEPAQAALGGLGYRRVPGPGARLAIAQSVHVRADRAGVSHSIDLHWQVSNRPRYRPAFEFDRLWQAAVELPGARAGHDAVANAGDARRH